MDRLFSPSFYGPRTKGAGLENKEGKKRGSIACHADHIEKTRLIRCLLYGFVDYSGKGTKPSDVLIGSQRSIRLLAEPEIDQSQLAKSVSLIISKTRFFLPCFHGSRASRLGHKRKEKNSVHNLPYGPRTRLIRGMYLQVFP